MREEEHVTPETRLSPGIVPRFPMPEGETTTVPTAPTVPHQSDARGGPVLPEPTSTRDGQTAAHEEEPDTWARRFLGLNANSTWPDEARRLAIAVGLASLFGVSLGLRKGGAAIALAAAGTPTGILAVASVAVPAFAIVLALADAPVDAMALAKATSRAAAKAGLVLAGLAPAAALFVVTLEDAITVTIVGFGGLFLSGAVASRSFSNELAPLIKSAPAATRAAMSFAMPTFLVFAAVLAARVWWIALPFLTEIR
jgi:hypothetical protein